jgi:hypothetical protein
VLIVSTIPITGNRNLFPSERSRLGAQARGAEGSRRAESLTRRNGRNVSLAIYPHSVSILLVLYTRCMTRRTPPGFYFILLVALVGFVYSAGLTRLSAPPLDAAKMASISGHGRVGVYLTAYALTKPSVMDAVYAARQAGQIDTLVINVKDMNGAVTYGSTVPLAHEIGAVTGHLDYPAILSDLHAMGFYLIARQVVFYDPPLATYLDLPDAWTPCDRELVCDYNLDIAAEVATLGFDELQFDYIRYPDGGALEEVYADRFTAVTAFVARADALLGDQLPLSADLFGRVMWPWNSRRIDPIGQSLEDLSPYLDFMSPMLYPSHYYEQEYRDDPYLTIEDALTSGSSRVNAAFRPFLQAFDRYIPANMTMETYIQAQIESAKANGADGYLFWNPSCEYGPLFRVLEPMSAN